SWVDPDQRLTLGNHVAGGHVNLFNTALNLARKLYIAYWSHLARCGHGLFQLRSNVDVNGYNFGLFLAGCNHADDDDDGEHSQHHDADNDLLFATQCHSLVLLLGGLQNLEDASTWKRIKQFH